MKVSILVFSPLAGSPKVDALRDLLESGGFSVRVADEVVANDLDPVLVVWTRADASAWHQREEEIVKAAQQGTLVSVLFQKTPLPPEIPAHPVIDLVNWRGSERNPYARDLLETLHAVANRTPLPLLHRPAAMLRRRLIGGLTVFTLLGIVFAFMMNVLAIQNNLCSIAFVQPGLSDACGYFGLGGKPTSEERIAWEARPPESCDALRDHMRNFENGAFRTIASDKLEARTFEPVVHWEPDEQRLSLYVASTAQGYEDRETARNAALELGERQAETLCNGFASTDYYNNLASEAEVIRWDCEISGSRHYCSFEGAAVCSVERKVTTRLEICG